MIYASLLVCIAGGAIYLVGRDRWVELGRLAFGIGLFVTLLNSDQLIALIP